MSLTQRLLPSNHKSVDASLQDQQMINTFARLHMAYMELTEQRKTLKKRLDDMESASVALLELDDAEVKPMLVIGASFFPQDSMDIDNSLETLKTTVSQEYETVSNRCSKIEVKLNQLREVLQQKFKSSINLDYES
ncbi:Prefoldin protein [Giardia duodenalis assemblage B]|uniref:Prefoldin subunit 4 n=1 Tax=Giardia duodenalis assemblage B TaxID=1394984 RepID=A0A132NUK5_GIAIN|nr:Prefoldin protein [Giardia intestinalis assemblage B]